VYLTSSEELEECVKKVQKVMMEFESLGEQSIEIVGLTKKIKCFELIQQFKKENPQYG
jgi:hypothetical protein